MKQFLLHPMRNVHVWLVCLLFVSASSFAQTRRITGTVTDAQGSLPGATVAEKGTANGTVTDINGIFSLSVTSANPILVVSFTGYQTQEVTAGSNATVNFTMVESDLSLTELVVTGYTVETRRQTTGAVATVKSRDLTAVPTGNVEQQLQGRVSGVTVITNGQPGTESIVRVRGFGAFGGNEPLYIVDGVPVGGTNFLSPDDIETTTVLKDAAAASIYGSRAANGVIVYTTKKGSKKPQKLTVVYDALVGYTSPGTAPEVLNPQEHADWIWTAIKNTNGTPKHDQFGAGASPVLPDYINVGGAAGVIGNVNLADHVAKYNVDPTAGPVYQVVKSNKAGTNWWDEITRNAPMTRHSLGFMGSTENNRYYLGLSLQNQDGILLNNAFKRYTFRANTEFDVFKNVRIGENIQFTFRQVLGQGGGGGGRGIAESESNVLDAFRMPTIIPVYDEFGGYAGTAAKGFNNPRNPVANRDGAANDRNFGTGMFGNLYAEIDLLKDFTFRSSIGGAYGSGRYFYYSRLQYENSENNGSFGYGEGYNTFFGWTFTNTLKYKKSFGKSDLDVLAGVEALNSGSGRAIDASGINPFSTNPDYINISTVSSKQVNSVNFKGVNLYSQFGRATYGYADKYYLTGVIRRDGASSFGASTRFGVFPAFSAAWRVTGEEFSDNISWLDDLKIRGGWGQMGNQNNVDPNNQYSLFGSSVDAAGYDISGSNTSALAGFYKSRIGNPDAKWETSTTTNVGFDALLLDGKWDLIVDLWKKETSDLLFPVDLPDVLGTSAAAPSVNIGTMLNKGIDLQLVNKGKVAKAGYELTLTGSWLKNEIVEIAPGTKYFDTRPPTNRLSTPPIRNQVGYSISAFYGYQVAGYFKDAADVAASPTQDGAGAGRFKFADLNGFDDKGELTGSPDGKIDAADRTYLGSPVPKFTGGMNLKVTVGNFEVETYLFSSVGNKIFNMAKWYTDFYPSFTWASYSSRVKNSWTPTNQDAETPIFENVSNFSTNTQANSWYVEDGSYLRMQNLSLAYNLPKEWFNRKLSRARVYVSTNNVFTISKYKGLDPGVGGAVDTTFGLDIGNYPVTRSFMFGVGVTF